ncbi:MAG: EutN/CcmL family microcompartment protein [Actinobacteria bacterium]|jgi:microcompartment protein CcmK/EutM|nr:EutN/CcmL family microcompartment protein [Actinomycetota bacterium]
MEIGKVVGSITSVSKIDELKPVKLFLVQLVDSDLKPIEDYIVAIDSIGVGGDDMVIITGGSGSRFTEITEPTHTDASIIARIDNLEV